MITDEARGDFPALHEREGRPAPAYLDSACMSLVPRQVLDAMQEYYTEFPGCAGRSLHRFAEEVTHRYEAAREGFARSFRAESPAGVVFVRNATEAINLVGQGLPWKRGESVLITDQEHNSNLVLWQRLRQERGVRLEVLPLPDRGRFDLDELDRRLTRRVRLVSLFHTSNLDGRSLPVQAIVETAHERGARVLLDGCQAAPHEPVDLSRIGADYYAVSGHKMLGPSGTGALLGKSEALSELRPLLLGGETVEWSTLEDHALRPVPYRFEAGLQNYAGIIGAYAGLQYLDRLGRDEVQAHDLQLNQKLSRELAESRVRLLGPKDPADRPSIFAFTLDGIDPNDAALFLDAGHDVMVRSGMHCVHSWYAQRGLSGNVRASFYLYNTASDVARLTAGIRELLERVPATPHPSTKSSPELRSPVHRRRGSRRGLRP